MEAKAQVRYLRMPAKKVRLVVNAVKNESVSGALTKLAFINKYAAPHVAKVIKSAAANASKNFGVDADKLFIKEIRVENGPILKYAKRFIARAQGRASAIKKRSAHITVVVSDTKPAKKAKGRK